MKQNEAAIRNDLKRGIEHWLATAEPKPAFTHICGHQWLAQSHSEYERCLMCGEMREYKPPLFERAVGWLADALRPGWGSRPGWILKLIVPLIVAAGIGYHAMGGADMFKPKPPDMPRVSICGETADCEDGR